MSKFKFLETAKGSPHEIELSIEDYRAAGQEALTPTEYINRKYPTDDSVPTAFEQACARSGLFLSSDKKIGITPPKIGDVFEGKSMMGGITKNDPGSPLTPASRLLYPEFVANSIFSEMEETDGGLAGALNGVIATTTRVNGARVDRAVIDVTAPKNQDGSPPGQLALPDQLMTITTSDKQHHIPSTSIGMEISDEAARNVAIDVADIALRFHLKYSGMRRLEANIAALVQGDTDTGEAAVSLVNASTYDANVNGTSVMTQLAWLKFQATNQRIASFNTAFCDVETLDAIDSRVNKPTIDTAELINQMNVGFNVLNLTLRNMNVIVLPDGVIPANSFVAFDPSYALQKFINVSASYRAVEEFVMRRGSGLRFDIGETIVKMQPKAFTGFIIGQ